MTGICELQDKSWGISINVYKIIIIILITIFLNPDMCIPKENDRVGYRLGNSDMAWF